MADGEQDTTYQTSFGNFVESGSRPGVYIADGVDQSHLIVPADVSRVPGESLSLDISPSTVFISSENGNRYKHLETVLNPHHPETTRYINGLSLVSSFANVSGEAFSIQTVENADVPGHASISNLAPVRNALWASSDANNTGPFALVTNSDGGGIVNLTIANERYFAGALAGLKDASILNAPQAYIDAIGSFVAGHEIKHLHDDRTPGEVYDPWQTLIAEIQGDHATLKSYFNQDYTSFVMDLRALGSINNAASIDTDDHATHIWSEEFETGVMPTQDEAQLITKAPSDVNRVFEGLIDNPDIIKSINENPAERYIWLSVTQAQGAYDDIPFGHEFIDKYREAAERRYQPEAILNASKDFSFSVAKGYLYDVETEMSGIEIQEKFDEDSTYRYAALSGMRDRGAFEEIPHGNEAVDRELACIREQNPSVVHSAEVIEMNRLLDQIASPTSGSAPTVAPMNSVPAPAMSLYPKI